MSHHADKLVFTKQTQPTFQNGMVTLPVAGQGVIIFSPENQFTQLEFFAPQRAQESKTYQYFCLRIDKTKYSFSASKKGTWATTEDELFFCDKGYGKYPKGPFWFSIDFENRLLKGGYGEPRAALTLFSLHFSNEGVKLIEGNAAPNFHPTEKDDPKDSLYLWLKEMKVVSLTDTAKLLTVFKDPITVPIPMVVKDTNAITMGDAANYNATVPANLPSVCQKLYENVGGRNFNLANINKDFKLPRTFDFAKAVQYSIDTKGKICYNIIEKKANEFGDHHPEMVYLRITMGANQGESPGIPYVMEIWPSNKRSPIHNHGGSEAIIKVLHGEIQVKLFATLSKAILSNRDALSIEKAYAPEHFDTATFKSDDVTYITPWFNQIHQLQNTDPKNACITIQCYGYPENDDTHYEYFNWLNEDDNEIDHFFPDSDYSFVDFVKAIYKEYSEDHKL